MDKLIKWAFIFLVVLFVGILAFVIPRDIKRTDRAQEIANNMGCTLIGSARDLNSIKFLDCNGEIKLIRVK